MVVHLVAHERQRASVEAVFVAPPNRPTGRFSSASGDTYQSIRWHIRKKKKMNDKNHSPMVVTDSSTADESIMVGDFFGNAVMPDVIPGTLREQRGYDFIDADLMAALPDTEDVWTDGADVREMVLYARYYVPFSYNEWYVTSKHLRDDGAVILTGYANVIEREWGIDLGMWDIERVEVEQHNVAMTVRSSDGSWVKHTPVTMVERDFDWKPMTAREAGMPTFRDSGFEYMNLDGAAATNVTVKWTPDTIHYKESPSGNPFDFGKPVAPRKRPSTEARKKAARKAAKKARRAGRAA